ncbi:MAG: hypothetical protein IPP51_17110 [Bacteroidetes bacterium]|nr:hypothetical protein [Bacteroidota bacterium]
MYRTYVKLGLGNYNIYNGELYVNALRSKTGALGISASHLSGNPGLKDVQAAGYSRNQAAFYGKYMLEHSTFSGDFNFDRNAVRYYGLSNQDSIVDATDLKAAIQYVRFEFEFCQQLSQSRSHRLRSRNHLLSDI